jgi:O-antigen/teichoic acid export membrane protein
MNIMLMRILGPKDFGLYSLFIAMLVIGTVFAGGGIDIPIIRLSAPYIRTNIEKSYLVFKAGFKIRLLISLAIMILGFLLSRPVINNILNKPDLTVPFCFAVIGIFGSAMVTHLLVILQSCEKFGKWALLNLIIHVSRITLLILLFLVFSFNLSNVLTIYVLSFFVSFFIGLTIVDRQFLFISGEGEKQKAIEILSFSKWTIIANIIYHLYIKTGIFILSYFRDPAVVGIYSGAVLFVSALDLLTVSIFSILIPKVCRLTKKEDYLRCLTICSKFSMLYLLVIVILFVFSRPLLLVVGGDQYEPSVKLFRILLFASFFLVFTCIAQLIFYSMNKPQTVTVLCGIIFLINSMGLIAFVPHYGAVGTAYISTIVRFIEAALFSGCVYFYISGMKKRET